MKHFLLHLFLFFMLQNIIFAQNLRAKYSEYGNLIVTKLANAPFPHPTRAEGFTYNDKFFPAEENYSDSTVAFFIPKGFHPDDKTDFVFHFHGWGNNVADVISTYNLIEQFSAARKNAILVIPQGPKNASDSFGGKLEDKNGFKKFVEESIDTLLNRKIISSRKIGNIILSGHSGGYHIISYILMRGGLSAKIKEVYLFDALYGQTEKFVYWLNNYNGKLINIYTENGGTKEESKNLMEDLSGWEIPYFSTTENQLSKKNLLNNRLIFIYTDLSHNEVIYSGNEFQKFLEASILKKL